MLNQSAITFTISQSPPKSLHSEIMAVSK